jgi:hypothetical protein
LKIAFDENVPIAMVRVFQAFANERQLQKIIGKFEIKSAVDYTPRPGDADYSPRNDVPWLKRFAADGAKVVITGNTAMKTVPHERLALVEHGFVVIFFEGQWSNWQFFRKCSLLLHWWPVIARTIKRARPGFWHIPCHWAENGKLRKVSSKDQKLLKVERKAAAKRRKRIKKAKPPKRITDGPLFEFADARAEPRDASQDTPAAQSGEEDGSPA